jgi:hypothetical protein
VNQPNDKKRPNTDSGAETRERKWNQNYIWVSKRILEVPVFNPDGSLTNIKQTVAEKHGRTYTYPMPGKPNSREDWRRILWNKTGRTRKETDAHERVL